MEEFKNKIIEILKHLNPGIEINVEVPPNREMGDFSFPCFNIAKQQKKSPNEIAKELSKKIDISKYDEFLEKTEVKGSYLNFFINKSKLIERVIKKINKEKEKFGSGNTGKGKTALIEHTSINPNASPHVGRARNALIGDSIVRIFKFQGYKTDVHYFVNDVGKQIAMLAMGCYGKEKVSFNDLLQIYIDINNRIAVSSEGETGVFVLLNKLEKGDKEIKEKFRKVVDICIKGQAKILGELGIKYDSYDYESKYLWDKKTVEILKKLEHTGKLFVDEEGRKVLNQEEFNLPMKSSVLVLTRADGTSLYPLRDLAYSIEKSEKKCDRNIIVLGEDQKLYFQQVDAALKVLNYPAPESVHYSFVLLKEGKMSTRKGNVVLLEDFMKEAREKAAEEVKKRERTSDIEKVSKIVGYGALKFAILKISPDKNVNFDWESALAFEGESGPYVQYSHARTCSIIKKFGKNIDADIDFPLIKHESEKELVKHLANFTETVNYAAANLRPHVIAMYAYELAKKFSEFYHACQCVSEDEELTKARVLLVDCTRIVLKNTLNLLGIDAPEEM